VISLCGVAWWWARDLCRYGVGEQVCGRGVAGDVLALVILAESVRAYREKCCIADQNR